MSRGGARWVPRGATALPKFCLAPQWPPQKFSGIFLKVLHRPLTAPLVAKLAPPVAPQMKMSGSAPVKEYLKSSLKFLRCFAYISKSLSTMLPSVSNKQVGEIFKIIALQF